MGAFATIGMKTYQRIVMVLAGIKLIFFLEVHVVLYFGFFDENRDNNKAMVLVLAEQCLLTQSQGLF